MNKEVLAPRLHQGIRLLLVRLAVGVGIAALALTLDGVLIYLSVPDIDPTPEVQPTQVEAPAPLTGGQSYMESAP